jgi:hypothetical protein
VVQPLGQLESTGDARLAVQVLLQEQELVYLEPNMTEVAPLT